MPFIGLYRFCWLLHWHENRSKSNLVGENTVTWVLLAPAILCSAYQGSCFSFIIFNIVSRGDRLEKPANIEVENNGAVGYVGSSLTVHNPLFFGHKLWLSKLMQCFY